MTARQDPPAQWIVVPDRDAVAREAADRFVAAALGAIGARGIFRVALSGGTTPNAVFPLLREPPMAGIRKGHATHTVLLVIIGATFCGQNGPVKRT